MTDNLFEQAATLARVQADGYRQVRERARSEAFEEAARLFSDADGNPSNSARWGQEADLRIIASDIRALKDAP